MAGLPERDVVLLQRPYVLRVFGLALAIVGIAVSLLTVGGAGLLWLVGLAVTGGVLVLIGGEGTARRVPATLAPDGVRVDGELIARRDVLRAGWVERGFEGTRVRIGRRALPDLRFEADDEEQARALLEHLQLSPTHSVMKFFSTGRAVGLGGAILGQIAARCFFAVHELAFSLGLGGLAMVGFFLVLREEIAIGCDGLLLSSAFGRRFVPFAEMDSAAYADPGKLVIFTRQGRSIGVHLGVSAAAAAAERIQAAIDMVVLEPDGLRRQLRREGDVGAWLARLRTLASPGSYRAAGLPGEALWRVVEEPGATATERAAAAVAIGTFATADERARLRRAAARVASPHVRVAIERVAAAGSGQGGQADEDELAEALAALEESAA